MVWIHKVQPTHQPSLQLVFSLHMLLLAYNQILLYFFLPKFMRKHQHAVSTKEYVRPGRSLVTGSSRGCRKVEAETTWEANRKETFREAVCEALLKDYFDDSFEDPRFMERLYQGVDKKKG
ncbi:uncharacterized protein LOC110899325 [Helianthus annuus]|uniref:uncharacterized protein LOC110899325 n=1 Tax=Helianthus annuus TaxID=4232 RepID=UPI000B8FEBDF|nr:uncharacterized protein LOC110899325 [Helianthus annuus]XP_022001911.1 uncharacterized protein LOC110899325 [Helianthus annuus]